MIALGKNETFQLATKSVKDFLFTYPNSIYTTIRTVNQTKIFLLNSHLDRLVFSSTNYLLTNYNIKSTSFESKTFKPYVIKIIQKAISYALNSFKAGFSNNKKPEFQITLVVDFEDTIKDGTSYNIQTYINPFVTKNDPIKIQAVNAIRNNPSIKYTEWVKLRSYLEKDKFQNIDEIVIMDNDGNITEGITSNFFIVKNGALYTCDEKFALSGTLRKFVISLCEKNNIQVYYESPNFYEAKNWDGCFITSTLRLLHWVDSLVGPSNEEITFTQNPLVSFLANLVRKTMEDNSQEIF